MDILVAITCNHKIFGFLGDKWASGEVNFN